MKQRPDLDEVCPRLLLSERFQTIELEIGMVIKDAFMDSEVDTGNAQRARQWIFQKFVGIHLHRSAILEVKGDNYLRLKISVVFYS
jgi:hypothetical protein